MKIYGHRGAKKYAPENTLPAFKKALQLSADGFELDTMLSKDRLPVVIHDRSLSRTSSGTGMVDRKTVEELKKLDAGIWFSDAFRGTRIPLLEEVLAEFGNKTLINIELKNIHAPFDALPIKVGELIKEYGLVQQILISSFIPFNLYRIRKVIPGVRVALLAAPDLLGKMFNSQLFYGFSPEFIHPHFSVCNKKFVIKQHAMGRKVNAWTVNDINVYKKMVKNGVDGIITDDPAIAKMQML